LVTLLRSDPQAYGMVTALGGYITKHAIGIYSCRPPTGGPKIASVQDLLNRRAPTPFVGPVTGDADIEGYTVVHDREGHPQRAFVACRIASVRSVSHTSRPRCWATNDDLELMIDMMRSEYVGRHASLRDGRLVAVG
jgi:acetyl-CoA C-acetyltransferase